jgi:small subunit ribosomal protein S16
LIVSKIAFICIDLDTLYVSIWPMLKMRLQRVGRKHEPTFRLVLTDSKNSTKSGRFLEILGSFDARKTTELLKVDRIKHWLDKGIMPTDTVHNLLVTHKIIDAKKKNVLPKKTPIVKEAPVEEKAPEAPLAETPVETAAEVETPTEEVISEAAPEIVKEPETVNEPTVEAPSEEVKSEENPA